MAIDQSMSAKRRTKNGAVRFDDIMIRLEPGGECVGRSLAATSRKRTKAFILWQSRLTALPIAISRATSGSAAIAMQRRARSRSRHSSR